MDDEAFFKDDITKGKLSGAIPLLGGQEALKRPEGVCSGRSPRKFFQILFLDIFFPTISVSEILKSYTKE